MDHPAAVWTYYPTRRSQGAGLLCFSAQLIRQNSESLVLHRYTMDAKDPIYGYWFFETYYQAFAKQLCCYSSKFHPTKAAEVEELLAYTVEM
jgi:hypothetical protein